MSSPALSTWCRAAASTPSGFCDRAEAVGARSLALDGRLPGDWLGALVDELAQRGSRLPVSAIEAPCPRPRASRAPRLATEDKDERRAALELHRETLRLAEAVGAPVVVVRLGGFDFDLGWPRLVRAFARREPSERRVEEIAAQRMRLTASALDLARYGLEPLLERAGDAGIMVGLANRARPQEIPDGIELGVLLEDFRGAPLAPWFDAAAAHAREGIGLSPVGEWLASYGPRAVGAWLGDACGLLGGLPWGRGEIDLAPVAQHLAATALRVVHAAPLATDEELTEALVRATPAAPEPVAPSSPWPRWK